jgi:hypothetical protein
MNKHQFEITATLKDESGVADAALHLGMALAKAGDVSITATEQSEALGMTRKEIVLSIVISFATSVAATVATDTIKEALSKVHCNAIMHVDITYDSASSAQAGSVPPADIEKKPVQHAKHSR